MNILRKILVISAIGAATAAGAADLDRARDLTREALWEADSVYRSGGSGSLYLSERNLGEVPSLIGDLPRSPAVLQVTRLADDAVRNVRGFGNLVDKARVVLNNGREIVRLLDILADNRDERDDRRNDGLIGEFLNRVDGVVRSVEYRDYRSATYEIQSMLDGLSRYGQDFYLRRASDSLVRISRVINDEFATEETKLRVTRDEAYAFRDAILNSGAYRRENF